MASITFKNDMTLRFTRLVDLLKKAGLAKTHSEIASLMEQPVQVISKLLKGGRIITLEQASALSKNAGVNMEWLLTGEGIAFKPETAEVSDQDVVTRITSSIFNGEIPKQLGEEIIDHIMIYHKRDAEQKEKINELSQKIIRMLELAKRYAGR